PVNTIAHHCQLPATPYCRTCCVTQFGVSLLNVVATIDSPASHQGTARPDAKNSDVFLPARLPKNSAGTKQLTRVNATMTQSNSWTVMVRDTTLPSVSALLIADLKTQGPCFRFRQRRSD